MNSQRLQKLHEFLKQEPDNPFLIYGLAIEYEKSDMLKAIELYELLLKDHPDYLPTYYQVAHIYWEQEENTKARNAFEQGIALAEKQNNSKAIQELKAAYFNFQMEN